MESTEKWIGYSVKIMGALQELFDEDSEHFIDVNQIVEEDGLTDFFHALSNVVPTKVFNKLTGDDKNYLEFNHLANQLVFQFSNKE